MGKCSYEEGCRSARDGSNLELRTQHTTHNTTTLVPKSDRTKTMGALRGKRVAGVEEEAVELAGAVREVG